MWHSIPLTLFWFTYFGSLGIFYPYFTLYLRENAGLTGTQVGFVLAISPLIGMIAQPLWGQVADRTGARTRVLAFLTLGTALGYLGLGYAEGFWSIMLATSALAVAGTAVFPLMTSVSLAILRDAGRHAFGRVRAWGTVGYFILVLILPWALASLPYSDQAAAGTNVSQPALGLMFPLTASLVLVSASIAFSLPKKGAVGIRAARGDWRELLHNRAFVRFLCFSLLAHFLMHGPMWLFPIFIRARGGDLSMIRNMWILMLIVEIPLVLSTGSGLKRLAHRRRDGRRLALDTFGVDRRHRFIICRASVARRDGRWPQFGQPALSRRGRAGKVTLDGARHSLHGRQRFGRHSLELDRRVAGRSQRDRYLVSSLRHRFADAGNYELLDAPVRRAPSRRAAGDRPRR
jgi:MFS family permease